MNWLLIAVICIIAWNVVRGYTRGVLRMVYSLAALGAMLASTMVDKMVDGFVTPEGMTLMLKGKDLRDAQQDSQDTQTAETQEQTKPEYEAGYTSMNDFEVVIKDQDQSKEVKVLMVRDGLSWKIHKIAVPMD